MMRLTKRGVFRKVGSMERAYRHGARLISIRSAEARVRGFGRTDDAPVTSLPVNYKYFALAAAGRLINWVKKTLGELIGPFKVAISRGR